MKKVKKSKAKEQLEQAKKVMQDFDEFLARALSVWPVRKLSREEVQNRQLPSGTLAFVIPTDIIRAEDSFAEGEVLCDEKGEIVPVKIAQEVVRFTCYYNPTIYPTVAEVLAQLPTDWRERKIDAVEVLLEGNSLRDFYDDEVRKFYTQVICYTLEGGIPVDYRLRQVTIDGCEY